MVDEPNPGAQSAANDPRWTDEELDRWFAESGLSDWSVESLGELLSMETSRRVAHVYSTSDDGTPYVEESPELEVTPDLGFGLRGLLTEDEYFTVALDRRFAHFGVEAKTSLRRGFEALPADHVLRGPANFGRSDDTADETVDAWPETPDDTVVTSVGRIRRILLPVAIGTGLIIGATAVIVVVSDDGGETDTEVVEPPEDDAAPPVTETEPVDPASSSESPSSEEAISSQEPEASPPPAPEPPVRSIFADETDDFTALARDAVDTLPGPPAFDIVGYGQDENGNLIVEFASSLEAAILADPGIASVSIILFLPDGNVGEWIWTYNGANDPPIRLEASVELPPDQSQDFTVDIEEAVMTFSFDGFEPPPGTEIRASSIVSEPGAAETVTDRTAGGLLGQ